MTGNKLPENTPLEQDIVWPSIQKYLQCIFKHLKSIKVCASWHENISWGAIWGSGVLFAGQQLPIHILLWTPKWKMHIMHIMHCSQNNCQIHIIPPKTSLSHIFNSLLMFSLQVVMQGALFGVSWERYLGDSTR